MKISDHISWLLVSGACGLMAFVIWQEVAQVRELANSTAKVNDRTVKTSVPVLSHKLEEAESRLAKAKPLAATTKAEGQNSSHTQKTFADIVKEPTFSKPFLDSVSHQIEERYSGLFSGIQLDAERTQAIKEVLAEQCFAGGFEEPNSDPRENLLKLENARNIADEKIRGILNAQQFAAYQSYRELMPANNTVMQFANVASLSGPNLSRDQMSNLVQILVANTSDPAAKEYANILENRRSRAVDASLAFITERVIKDAAFVLNPQGLKILQELQKQQAAAFAVGTLEERLREKP